MSNTPKTPQTSINIPVNFRWPITKTDTNQIIVEVPTVHLGTPVVVVTEDAMNVFRLSDKEIDKAFHAAQEAALRAIMILE